MSRFGRRTPQTVRPQAVRRLPVLRCLLAFGLCATAVYYWGCESRIPADVAATYTATAYVVERPNKAAGETRIPLAYSDAVAQRAKQVADTLAERYAQDRRLEWQQRMAGPCAKAREAAEQAKRELVAAEGRLDAFRREMAEDRTKPQAAGGEKQATGENPRWLELDRQLSELQRRRDDLLVDRTPLHPSVQDVDMRIEDIKQQMAAITRQMPGNVAATPGENTGGEDAGLPELVAADHTIGKPHQEKLNELTANVERIRHAYEDAETAEKWAVAQQKAGPQYTVVYADAVGIPASPSFDGRHVLWTALVAGVLMAFGVGSVSTGASIEPTVGSRAAVQVAARAPVIGVIPADDPIAHPDKRSRRQSRVRRLLVGIGLILIAACPLAAIWGIVGR